MGAVGIAGRDRITLDGRWALRVAGEARDREVQVPGPWQAGADDLRTHAGAARYARTVDVPRGWIGRPVRLCFGAVDYWCAVSVNGTPVGEHEGGYLPFALDVGAALRPGENTVVVDVEDPGPGHDGRFAFADVPHGKQSWYGPLGGIWQSAYLEALPPAWLEDVRVTADPRTGTLAARARVVGDPGSGRVRLHVTSPDGMQTWRAEAAPDDELAVGVGAPSRWGPGAPRLYRLALELGEDRVERWAGFRSVGTQDGLVLVNDVPVYLRGALDQDYYLGGICTPPSDDVLREQVLRAHELGLNLLRCHIKVPDPRYLDWADRLGILLWCELPNAGRLSPDARRRLRETLAGIVARDGGHPSVVAWSIINESWGIDLGDAEQRAWLADTFAWAKRLDPTRLWVDNSACIGNFHVRSDLNDFHWYSAFPDGAAAWSQFTARWTADPGGTWSPHGDAQRRGDEPLVLSEFGVWGLPDVAGLRDAAGAEPWWFDTGEGWGGGTVVPRGVERRFDEWGLDEVFGSWRGFVAESQRAQGEGLAHQIRDIRRRPAIAGYVITELTDVHWECNGLLDMARNPKAFHDRLSDVNADDVVIPWPQRRRVVDGEPICIEVAVSHFSARDLDRFRVVVRLDGEQAAELEGGEIRRGRVADLGAVELRPAPAGAPVRRRVELELVDRRGARVNGDAVEILSLPPAPPVDDEGPVLVRGTLDERLLDHVHGGGRAVVVVEHEGALGGGLGLCAQRRAGGRWEGDWAQGMGFLRPALRRGLALGPRVDGAFVGLTPEHVLLGAGAEHHADLLAGLYLGWIHAVAGTAVAARHGQGRVVITSFPLLRERGDVLAGHLLARLVELAADGPTPGFALDRR